MIIELDLQLQTDACLSTSNHTLGEPETHQYIPGRTLWGALANLAYRSKDFSEQEAFRIFQQGAVQLSDALPVRSDHRSYPVPLAWHEPKNTPGQKLQNFALAAVRDRCKNEQHQGRKTGWVAANLTEIIVPTDYSLRTSVDASGKARDGLLFGLPVVRAGTRFHATLRGTEADLNKVMQLLKHQELRVGRSKNSELGLVKVRRRAQPIAKLGNGSGSAQRVSLLCVSRCIFRDPNSGAPTLQPGPESFGLPGDWQFDSESSFVRTARVVHFNAKRGRPETERFAIERGSVLTFHGSQPVDLQAVARFLEEGAGEHRGQGYGEVLAAPSWLTEERPISLAQPESIAGKSAKEPTDPLFLWASRRAREKDNALTLYGRAEAAADALRRCRVPGSQWGVLRRMAREARFQPGQASRLKSDVTNFLGSGKRKLSDGWKRASKLLDSAFAECKHGEDLPMFLEFLASACMRPAAEQKGQRS